MLQVKIGSKNSIIRYSPCAHLQSSLSKFSSFDFLSVVHALDKCCKLPRNNKTKQVFLNIFCQKRNVEEMSNF